jgi:NAD(P)H-flavin reductase
MAYQDRFKDWEASGVEVVPVLSQPHNNWTGEQGYVQAAFAKTKGIIKAAQVGAFLCGHKEMAQVYYSKPKLHTLDLAVLVS